MESIFSSTIQLAAAIRARQISATEALEAHLAQIDARNPILECRHHPGHRARTRTGAGCGCSNGAQ